MIDRRTCPQPLEQLAPMFGRLCLSLLLLCAPCLARSPQEELRLRTAEQSLQALQACLDQQRLPSQALLNQLQNVLGRESFQLDKAYDCRLRNLTRPQLLSLTHALRAMLAASRQQVTTLSLDGLPLQVRNPEVAALLRPQYTPEQFEQLLQLCHKHRVFQVKVHPTTGLIATSGGEENPDMASRQWVTDSLRCGILQPPADRLKVLITLARFYTGAQEQAAFRKAIDHPKSYREGGPVEGVAHIFFPATLQRDPSWFNNKRLESHGLALQALCQAVLEHPEWPAPPEVWTSIELLGQYFLAIDYPTAPSAGNWEETPFPGGLTWDTQAIRGGLQALLQLVQQRPIAGLTPDSLTQAIKAGQQRLRRTYLAESPGHREMDSSLVFLSQTDLRLADDPLQDVQRHLEMLEKVEQALVRPQGMIRYAPFQLALENGQPVSSPDSYLTLNYNVAIDRDGRLNLSWKRILDDFGSKDASEPQVFAARARLSTPHTEAEWFMVSDLAHGYAYQAEKLLKRTGPEARRLQHIALQGATRNLNRAFARITPPGQVWKANGEVGPGWAVPEAYQYVSTLWEDDKGGRTNASLAGVNTPLSWASASLLAASQAYLRLLRQLELPATED